jgi:allantoicase
MEKMTLTVTASQENDSARNALDDKPDTRWTTGRAMQPGDWFAIDLGREALVKKITLDSTQSPGDYPRGYEVCTSFDGQTWSKPVLTGKQEK